MKKDQRALLILVSRMLLYPSEWKKNNFDELVEDIISSSELKEEIKERYNPLCELSEKEIQELYVETFDLKSNSGLYLTAYELGDSTLRGAALIRLQKVINQAGFERDHEELADYIPMLLQFLAVAPAAGDYERLEKRVGVAIHYMKNRMSEDNPYTKIVSILTDYVFPQPTAEELKELELSRDEADLEELPYPIMYQ